jgi:myo-inositol-1(or 4)-monophosphatase
MERYKEKTIEFMTAATEIFTTNFHGHQYKFNEKSHKDYVTEVDLNIENLFREFIKNNFPTHSILGEEGSFDDKQSDWLWAIDPIDGTTNYINHNPDAAIVVGLRYKGLPVLAVSSFPIRNEFFYSQAGKGTFLNGERVSPTKEKALGRVLLSSTYLNNPQRMVTMVGEVWDNVAGVRMSMCSLAEACDVAVGRTGVAVLYGLGPHEWPVAYLIAKEAGCVVSNLEDPHDELLLSGVGNKNIIIAGNNALLRQASELIHLPPPLK